MTRAWKKTRNGQTSWLCFYRLKEMPCVFSGLVVKDGQTESLTWVDNWADDFKKFLLEHVSLVDGIVTPRQVHQDRVVSLKKLQKPDHKKRFSADGLLTDERGLFLTIQVADCLPIYVIDPSRKVVGLLHAGWRGTLMQIAGNAVDEAKESFGCSPKDLQVLFGPAIGKCCYEVSPDIAILFPSRFVSRKSGLGPRLDLCGCNQASLLKAGVKKENIFSVDECTCCGPEFLCSYRGGKNRDGRMLAFIGIK